MSLSQVLVGQSSSYERPPPTHLKRLSAWLFVSVLCCRLIERYIERECLIPVEPECFSHLRRYHRGRKLTSRDTLRWARFARSHVDSAFCIDEEGSFIVSKDFVVLLVRLGTLGLDGDSTFDTASIRSVRSNLGFGTSLRLLPVTLPAILNPAMIHFTYRLAALDCVIEVLSWMLLF
jgi:hypothetical protein